MISHSEKIKVPIEKVWEHFLYKIEHPEHFVPGASNAVIKEKSSDYIIREMDIALPNGLKARISEKITYSPYNVKFQIIDHPIYKGHVDNIAEKFRIMKPKSLTHCIGKIKTQEK
ncbi:MAG: AtaL-like protein [Bacteroidia bacterium]